MNKFLLAILCFTAGQSFAQSRSNIKGAIIDSLSKMPLEKVTIAITDLKDSSFIAYTSTTKSGQFFLKNMPSEKPVVLIASIVGYTNFVKIISLKRDETLDLGDVSLRINSHLLNEVVIKTQKQAIVINKDTIEFDASAFKVRPNAVFEELLKKLPGVQINKDGTITVNGKSVSKLTIDGKQFFGNDPKIALKNLDADLISKITIYDDREDDPNHLIEDSRLNKIIDIKFKKAFKKSLFGKVYAGGGSRERFESGGLFNMFRDTLQVSVIGVGNNLNKTGFSSNDLSEFGGFNRSGEEAIYDGSISVGGNGSGIEKIFTTGFNINNDYGNKLKMNFIYFFNNSTTANKSSSLFQQFLKDDTLISANSYNSDRLVNKHNASTLIQWKPDTLTSVRYTAKFNSSRNQTLYSNEGMRYNFSGPLNQTEGSSSDDGSVGQFQHSFNYFRKLKRQGETFSLSQNLSLNPDQSDYYNNFDLTSLTTTLSSEAVRRFTGNDNRRSSAGLDLTYRYPFNKKFTAEIKVAGKYEINAKKLINIDQNPLTGQYDILLHNQSTDLKRNLWSERFKLGGTYVFSKKTSLDMGLSAEWQQIQNRFNVDLADLNQQYLNFLPSIRLQVGSYSLNYNSSINQPSIYNLQPVTLQTSQLYAFTGNPALKPSRVHNLDFNLNKYLSKRQLNIYAFFNGSFEENSVATMRTVSFEGASTTTPVNKNGKYTLNLGTGIYKNFKKSADWQVTMNPYLYLYYFRNFFILNEDEGFQHIMSVNFRQEFNINWKDKIELSPSFTIRPQLNTYTGVNYQSNNFVAHNFETEYKIRWPKRIYWEGNYSYNYNPLASAGFQKSVHLLNSSVALQMFKKDRAEIKLSCYDLLDQNINSYRYTGQNSTGDSQNEILKRYFLVTYLIKFNKTTTK